MAKDYFEDISPEGDGASEHDVAPEPAPTSVPVRTGPASAPPRGIRSISAPRSRARVGADMRASAPSFEAEAPTPRRRARWWLWALAAFCVLVVAGLGLFAFRSTTVIVVPKSQSVVFDASSTFTAYPSGNAATGTLAYSVQTSELEDSEVVPSSGTSHVETKASGSITVYNSYSASSVKLIKKTRFQTPDGRIFRTPSEVVVPGKKGSTPGQVSVTVVADAVGDTYNVGPIDKFTVPGLKSSPDMYAGVYAKSTTAFSGGFSGDQPAVAPGALDTAVAAVRARLETKARAAAGALSSDSTMIFSDLVSIEYQDLPHTTDAGGGVRIHEKAILKVPTFPAGDLAQTIARSVSADAENAPIKLLPGKDFAAHLSDTSATLGSGPINFSLAGNATLVWVVDPTALAQALAGRDQGAFQGIVDQYPGVQEAHARIEPFWKHSFPSNPSGIKITVAEVAAQ